MCINPMKIPDVGFVACRECWQCRETKVDDWVGRCIAESKTAKAAHVITLTYGQDRTTGDIDHIRAAVLTYSDVQKYLKYLRIDGFPCRYFVVGEYGSLKGRAHWHIIIYWLADVPDHKLRENFIQKHWPHGWSYWDKISPEAIRYACKYLLKDAADDEQQGCGPMMSKKPPLGFQYFRDLADVYVKQHLSPQNLFYSFPDVRRVPNGFRGKTNKQFREAAKPVQFRMHGKTAENFLSYFIDRWREVFDDEPPRSEVIWALQAKRLEEYCQSAGIQPANIEPGLHWEEHGRRLADHLASADLPRSERHSKGPVPFARPFEGAFVQFCEKANCYFTDTLGVRLWYSNDSEGDAGWHEKIGPREHNPIETERRWLDMGFRPESLLRPFNPRSPWT